MSLQMALHIAGATISAGLGLLGLINPTATSRFVNLTPQGKIGLSELRATYGGFFLALGGFAILSREPEVFIALGLAWAGAAAGRLLSVLLDRSFSAKNFGGIVFEAAIAWLLLTPRIGGF